MADVILVEPSILLVTTYFTEIDLENDTLNYFMGTKHSKTPKVQSISTML